MENSLNEMDDSFVEVFRSYQSSNLGVETNTVVQEERKRDQSIQLKTFSSTNQVIHGNDNLIDFILNQPISPVSNQKHFELSDILKGVGTRHCPICFKRNTFDQVSLFISHMKSCAAKNNISTEQLMKAIELLEKQISERTALGLPTIVSERTAMGMDSNMELAMALSVSLRDSEMIAKLKETETLLEAGLEQEAISQCRQLENFGFMSSKPASLKQKTASRSKVSHNTVLFTRSQAERERIITEKIAIVLIDSDKYCLDPVTVPDLDRFKVRSKFLQNLRNENFSIWKKSYQLDDEAVNECYYVKNLSGFISPSNVQIGGCLKHVSQIPCRRSSPDDDHFNRYLQDLVEYFEPTVPTNPVSVVSSKTSEISRPILRKPSSKLSHDWKSLVNKKFMSDITIYVKNERCIFAHKLVLYARCGSILEDTIKETENNKTTEIIMWMEFCYESVIAFLEYVYADTLNTLENLDEIQLFNLNELCTRYNVVELQKYIDQVTIKNASIMPDNLECKKSVDCKLPSSGKCSPLKIDAAEAVSIAPGQISEGEKNLMFLQMAFTKQSKDEQASPEMFEKSETSLAADDPVDDDFSLSICDSSPTSCANDPCSETSHSYAASIHSEPASKSQIIIFNDIDPSKKRVSSSRYSSNIGEKKEAQNNAKRDSVLWTCDTDIICLSDDNDFCNVPVCTEQVKLDSAHSEKRKSHSPLVKSLVKKKKSSQVIQSSPGKENTLRKTAEPCRRSRKKSSSQIYSLSDSMASSDSDVSLYEINPVTECNTNEQFINTFHVRNSPANKSKSVIDCGQKKFSESFSVISSDTSFELDDFRHVKPEVRIATVDDHITVCGSRSQDANHIFNPANEEKDVIEMSYVSPIWEGFDAVNTDYMDLNFSPSPSLTNNSPISKFSTPMKDLVNKNRSTHATLKKIRKNSISIAESSGHVSQLTKRSTSDIPSFESFSIDESVLNRLEKNQLNLKALEAQSQIVTPQNVRKLKARSKSDSVITPSPRSSDCITPMADYSAMKTCELKKELDKYGIKPGLGKRQAKLLLKHIYDKLHPVEEKTTSQRRLKTLKEKQKLKKMNHTEDTYSSNSATKNNTTVSTDSDDTSCDSFASGIDILEESFTEEKLNESSESSEEMKSEKVTLDAAFRSLLQADKELHTHILHYKPVWLETIKNKLIEMNVQCSKLSLMNYLNDKCITFDYQKFRRVRRKRKKHTNVADT